MIDRARFFAASLFDRRRPCKEAIKSWLPTESFTRIRKSKLRMTPPASSVGNTPQPGQLAPDFKLPDSTGTPHRLSELAATEPLVLLFYRGHW